VREKIIGLLELEGNEKVWEIGPGLGAMTSHLLSTRVRLFLFEIDRMFIEYLEKAFGDRGDLKIIPGDVLKTWRAEYELTGPPDRVIGNLPYNSAAAIIASFIEQGNLPPRMVYTVQKEVGERMLARPGTKDYSAFTVLCSFACSIRDCGNVPAGNFYPSPHVMSKVVLLTPCGRYDFSLLPMVSSFTRAVFASRRKTIRNNLQRGGWWSGMEQDLLFNLLRQSGIEPGDRGENLSVDSIVSFVQKIRRHNDTV